MPSYKHGLCKHPLYQTWLGLKKRCTNPKTLSYKWYAAKGISFCKEWNDFLVFLRDVGPRPTKQHTLDRWPNKLGNYEPNNIRWATPKQQARNTTLNHLITYNNKTLTLTEWSEITGLKRPTLEARIRAKWSLKDALSLRVNNHLKIRPTHYKYIKSQLGKKPIKDIAIELNVTTAAIGYTVRNVLRIKNYRIPPPKGKKHPTSKPFVGLNTLTKEKRTFYSLKEAATYVNSYPTNISRVLNKKSFTVRKWKFDYKI